MRRAIGIGCAAVVLAGALVATWAGDRANGFGGPKANGTNVYKGKLEGGGQFAFAAKFKQGEPIKMGYVEALYMTVECDGERERFSLTHDSLDTPVRKRKFALDSGEIQQITVTNGSDTQPVGDEQAFTGRLTGKLDTQGRKSSGTLDLGRLDLADSEADCDASGPRKWEAKLTTKYQPYR